jgi:dihydroneopterin aldolase
MALPYVPIASYTTYDNILTALEVTTDAAEPNADDLATAVNNAEASKNIAESVLETKFDLLFLVGC